MIRAPVACAALVAAACRPALSVEHAAIPAAGISIALYQDAGRSYSVVDDRRWVEVTGATLVLDHLDPGAALPSLVIEPLGPSSLGVGACTRDRLAAAPGAEAAPGRARPVVASVRCRVTGSGRHLVRVLYVSSTLGYRAQHDLTMTAGDRATLATRFAIATPAWRRRAEVRLFAGMPGADRHPEELARGTVELDGTTAVLAAPARELPAHLRRIYDGALRTGSVEETSASWARDSVHAVWVWLELEGRLSPGPVHAHVAVPGEAIRDLEVPAAGRAEREARVRLPLWIDDQLRGTRQRSVLGADGASLADRFVLSVANTGDAPREVWIEERLRAARRRTIKGGWPTRPTLAGEVVRTKLRVAPGAIERTGYAIEYVF